jgi:hypothetical protein
MPSLLSLCRPLLVARYINAQGSLPADRLFGRLRAGQQTIARHERAHLVVIVLSVDVCINVVRIVGKRLPRWDLWMTKAMQRRSMVTLSITAEVPRDAHVLERGVLEAPTPPALRKQGHCPTAWRNG